MKAVVAYKPDWNMCFIKFLIDLLFQGSHNIYSVKTLSFPTASCLSLIDIRPYTFLFHTRPCFSWFLPSSTALRVIVISSLFLNIHSTNDSTS